MSRTAYAPEPDLAWYDDAPVDPVDEVLVDRAMAGDRVAIRQLSDEEWLEAMRVAKRRRWSVSMVATRMHTRMDRVKRLAGEAGVDLARTS